MSELLKGENVNDFYLGQPVAYIPSHLVGGKTINEIETMIHNSVEGIQFGIVKTKKLKSVHVVFYPQAVMFGLMNASAPGCYFRDLYFGAWKETK